MKVYLHIEGRFVLADPNVFIEVELLVLPRKKEKVCLDYDQIRKLEKKASKNLEVAVPYINDYCFEPIQYGVINSDDIKNIRFDNLLEVKEIYYMSRAFNPKPKEPFSVHIVLGKCTN